MDSLTVHRRKPDISEIRNRASAKNRQEVKLKERHLFVLKKLLKRNHIGFLLKELSGIAKILDICAERAKDHPEYVLILCEALKLCRLPFLKERTSDELTYAQDTIDFLSHMGCLMRVSDAEVRQNLVECVRSFYSCVVPKLLLDGTDPPTKPKLRTVPSNSRFSRLSLRLQQTSTSYRLQLLEYSDLPQTFLLSMVALENQPNIRLQLLHTLQLLSSSSDLNCAALLCARGAETICLHMNEADPSGQVLIRSTEILWNLVERCNKEEVTEQLSSLECVVSLKEAFLHHMLNKSQPSNVQLRNDLLVITSLLAESPKSQLVESFFARQLVIFAISPELRSHNALVPDFKMDFSLEDMKLKKLLLNLLVLMSSDFAAQQIYKEERVMLALLTLVKPPEASSAPHRSGSRHWSALQGEELQLQALATLATLAPILLDDYKLYQGNACLLMLLDWCVVPDSYFGQGQSFHSIGGRGSKKAQMRLCIRALRSITSLCEESVNQDLCDQGIISQLLGILNQMEESPDEDDAIALEVIADIQLILSTLCEPDMHRKELFGSEGVEMVLHFLKKGTERFYSGLGHNKLILSTVDCVWSCIVGCYTTEDYFLAKEGTFLLLDLLSTSPGCVHGIVLSTLLELCDNPNTLSHILSWRPSGGGSAPGLLLQMWRQEEEMLGVARDPHGAIADPRRPILTRSQQEDAQHSFPAHSPGAAVLELSENLRSKIYSIFCKIGFQELPGLTRKDYVTLSIIRRYLDFKVGEVWDEISQELREGGVRPISPDQKALSSICSITEDTARRVMEDQRSIIELQQKEESSEEELLYTEITVNSHCKQKELAAKSWDNYVSRTSNYEVLKEVKAQREKCSSSSKPEDSRNRPTEHVIGHVMTVEHTDDPGLEGVNVKLASTNIKSASLNNEETMTRDPEYFSTVSIGD
ncbi:cilia- and flagella-associated protein 69 isoform X2 [Gouania willdenowi]|uniref:cilia- and flagella-associated protein 69 isoform X2 n=1 Tax=Gouania willdenowi TaxID=441366 RepID=UPI00105511B8|nr:cilia- and flagella-associated protein 69 isoform X2 [Gouania willdenowi]